MTNEEVHAVAAERAMTAQVLDRGRPLGAHEVAFLRELLEGLPAKRAKRHLFTADRTDAPEVDQALRRLRDALTRAATAGGKPHLLAELPFDELEKRLALERARERRPREPDTSLLAQKKLEIHRRAVTDGFSDEDIDAVARDELIAEGKWRKPPPTEPLPAPRWNILNARTAVELLRPLVTTPPAASHPIDLWFRGGTLASLRAAGVASVADLTALILQRGHRWHQVVPRMGLKRAMRIAAWLRAEHAVWGRASTMGVAALAAPRSLTGGELATARASVNAIVPFEAMVLQPGMDGADGTNRERIRGCILETATDHGAIERWLKATCTNVNTRRAYGREAERLLLWSVAEKHKPLSSLTVEDCIEYREFLLCLGDDRAPWPWRRPRGDWIAPRPSLPRASPLWKPFAPKPMSAASIERALVILRAMFDWMVNDVHYLAANPWRAVNLTVGAARSSSTRDRHLNVLSRSLSAQERGYVEAVVDGMPEGTPHDDMRRLRARVIVQFAMCTGLRREELAGARIGDVTELAVNGSTRFLLQVIGKGAKRRTVSLPAIADRVLQAYLSARGHWPVTDEAWKNLPLVARLPGSKGPQDVSETSGAGVQAMSAGRLYVIAKWVFGRAAEVAKATGDHKSAERLKRASTHWLRHTFGTQLGNGNVDVRTIMLEMGHADIATTLTYISPDHAARFEQVDKAFSRQNP